jgi:hypothetical protein
LLAGIGAVRSVAWVRAAWHWRTLLVATAAFVLLIWLPSLGASWRPARLPPAWAEPLLAGTRLLLIAVAMLLGAAVAVTAVARGVRDRAAVRNEG